MRIKTAIALSIFPLLTASKLGIQACGSDARADLDTDTPMLTEGGLRSEWLSFPKLADFLMLLHVPTHSFAWIKYRV